MKCGSLTFPVVTLPVEISSSFSCTLDPLGYLCQWRFLMCICESALSNVLDRNKHVLEKVHTVIIIFTF